MSAEHDPALWNIFRKSGDIWHRTSLPALGHILEGGHLVPNSGQFPATYPQSNNSYASRLPAVALFDFDAADDPEFTQYASAWESVLLGKLPGVVIGIDRSHLAPERLLLPKSVVGGDDRLAPLGDTSGLTIIPGVEALYLGQIPVQAFNAYIMLDSQDTGGLRWQLVEPGPNAMAALCDIASAWRKECDFRAAARQASGDFTYGELVELSFQSDNPVEG